MARDSCCAMKNHLQQIGWTLAFLYSVAIE
jgi:hypothetical protein